MSTSSEESFSRGQRRSGEGERTRASMAAFVVQDSHQSNDLPWSSSVQPSRFHQAPSEFGEQNLHAGVFLDPSIMENYRPYSDARYSQHQQPQQHQAGQQQQQAMEFSSHPSMGGAYGYPPYPPYPHNQYSNGLATTGSNTVIDWISSLPTMVGNNHLEVPAQPRPVMHPTESQYRPSDTGANFSAPSPLPSFWTELEDESVVHSYETGGSVEQAEDFAEYASRRDWDRSFYSSTSSVAASFDGFSREAEDPTPESRRYLTPTSYHRLAPANSNNTNFPHLVAFTTGGVSSDQTQPRPDQSQDGLAWSRGVAPYPSGRDGVHYGYGGYVNQDYYAEGVAGPSAPRYYGFQHSAASQHTTLSDGTRMASDRQEEDNLQQEQAAEEEDHAEQQEEGEQGDDTQDNDDYVRCNICERHIRRSYIRRHMRRAHGNSNIERPHVCSECGKRFQYRKDRLRHERTHSGERNFECPICHRTFTREDNSRRHSSRYHRQ